MKLVISSLEVSDLVDTGGRWDAQDPAVKVTVGAEARQTERLLDAGVAGCFPLTETLQFELPPGTSQQEIEIEVLNVGGMMSSTKHIGLGKINLKDILSSTNKEADLTVKLTHKKKKEKGIVKLHAKVIDDPAPPAAEKKEEAQVEHVAQKDETQKQSTDKSTAKEDTPTIKQEKEKPVHEKEKQPTPVPDEKAKTPIEVVEKSINKSSLEMKEQPPSPEASQKETSSPFTFDKAFLHVVKVSASNLKNVETFGKNDPYVQLSLGEWKSSTDSHENAGANSEWVLPLTDDSMRIEVSSAMLKSAEMDVVVKDQNDVFSDSLIGNGKVDMSALLNSNDFDKEKSVTTILHSKDGKKETGSVILTFIVKAIPKAKEPPKNEEPLQKKEESKKGESKAKDVGTDDVGNKTKKEEKLTPEIKPALGPDTLPLDFKVATLVITKIEAHNLKNVEGFMGGKNDPYVKLCYGEDKWKGETAELSEAGAEAMWDIPAGDSSMQFKVKPAELRALKMSVSAMDKNIAIRGDAFIGTGENYLHSSLDKQYGEDCAVKFQLKDNKTNKAGEVVLHFRLQKVDAVPEPDNIETQDKKNNMSKLDSKGQPAVPFTSGTIEIHTIKCQNLKNVEIMGKNDPYVKLAFSGSEWVDATLPLDNVDTPVWKDLDMDIEVTADMIDEDRISVEVWDQNTAMKDKFIGRGDTSVQRLLQTLDSPHPIDLIIPLQDDKKKIVGEAIIFGTLKRYKEKKSMTADIDESFQHGTLCFERIRAKNLINTETVGKQDPYCVFKLAGKDDLTTSYKEGGGSLVVWNSLDMKFTEVSRAVLKDENLLVEVWDHNSITKDKMIGTGSVSIAEAGSQLGEVVELVVDLETKKGGVAGKLVLDVKLTEGVEKENKEIKYEISEGFNEGKVHIRKISVFDAADTEMIGAGQQDLYTVVGFKEWSEKTEVQDDVGSDAVWENLDMNFDITAESLKNDLLTIQVFDANMMKDTLIGSNEKVSLMQAGASVGEIVEIKVNLPLDKKGKSTGRVVLFVEVRESEPEEEVFEVNEEFTAGCIHIEKICAYNLNGSSKSTKMSPSVKVKFEEFEKSTTVATGVSPVWDLLDIKPPVSKDGLKKSKLLIEVYNKKKRLGTGEVGVTKAGASINEQVEIRVDIVDASQKAFAYAILYMTVKEETAEAAISAPKSSIEEDIDLPPGFLQGIVYITSVKSYGLKNPDFIGKADPYIEVLFESKLGNFCEKTPVYENAGEQVVWDDVNFKVKLTGDDILANKKFKVNAWDKNSGKDTHTASAEISMRKLVKAYGNEVTLNVDLTDSKGKRAGRLVMVAELRESEPEPEVFLPKDFTAGILKVIQICTFDLKNLEMFGAGKQDPYCKVKAGDFFSDKTFEKEEGGSDVVWDYLDMQIPVTADFLTSDFNFLEIEAWESNILKDEMIGKGEVSLKKVVNIGEDVELSVPLYDEKKASTGRLTVLVRLENLPPKEIVIAPNFQEGTMNVRRIVAHGLKNMDWFGKADPFVELTLSDWEGKTNSLTNKGSNVMWDFLDMKMVVTRDMLKSSDKVKHTITAKVLNKNSIRKDSLIGRGEVNITKAFTTLGTEVELSIDLLDAAGQPTGRLVLYALVTDGIEPDESTMNICPEFEFGSLCVGKIRSFELKNTELMGLQDPFVVINLGSWEDKTFTKDDGGGDVLWDFLDLRCDVTSEMLLSEKMMITVWDENKGRKNALIGRGECSLIKPGANIGKEVEIAVSLKDDKEKYSGRLVLYVTLQDEEVLQEGTIPESFCRGELHIRRLNGFSLKNTEIFGTQDPYVILKLGDDLNIKTKVHEDAGLNPSWKNLDFKAVLNATTVRVEEMEVEVWNKNSLKDDLIGIGHVSLRPAACSLGQDVELHTQLTTKKGKPAGRINIGVLMKELPPEAVEKEIILPDTFKSGIVHFHKIIAKGLQNKEFAGGKQDPYVKLEVAGWSNRTKTLTDAGSSAIWSDIEGLFTEVDRSILADCKLKAIVMDENNLTSHALLGVGSISLRKLAPKINSPVELCVDLSDNGVSCGRLLIYATLREAMPDEIVDTVDESMITLKQGSLAIKQVETIDIIGGDSSLLDNKQDQYVKIELQRWSWQSPVQDNIGASAVWKDISGVVTEVNGDVLKHEQIKITVFDKNKVTSDSIIGSGTAALRKAGACLNKDTPIRMRLMDKHKMPVGTAVVTVQVNASAQHKSAHGDQLMADAKKLPKFGFFEISEISASGLKNTEWFGKQDPYAVISLGTNFSMQTDVLTDAGSNPVWKSTISEKIVSAQLGRDKIKITFMHKNRKKDDKLGEGFVTGVPLLAHMDEWVDLSQDLTCDHKPAGSFTLKCKYRPANEEEQHEHKSSKEEKIEKIQKMGAAHPGDEVKAKEIDALNSVIKDMKSSQKDLLARLGGMENSISKQLHEEMAAERKRMQSMLAKQSKQIDESIGKLGAQKKDEDSDLPWHGMTMTELQNVSLPRNIYDWRAAHVQAWVSLQLDLPQYIQQFHDSSIDGIVLLKFVDEDVLKESLGVSIPLHRHKIMAGISSLRDSQDEVERKKKEKRAEAARLAAEQAERDRLAASKVPKKKKKKKKKTEKMVAATWFGDVREHNDLERIKLERIMREKRAEQKKAKTRQSNRSGVWKFEYTGGAPPVDPTEEVWTDSKGMGNNTKTYEKNMMDLFSTNLTSTMPTAASYSGKLREVPSDSVFDEVLAITRAAMFDVSNRLVEIEMINDQKNLELNSDLDDFGGGGGGGDESYPEYDNLEYDDISPPPFDDTVDDELGDSIPDPSTVSMPSFKQEKTVIDEVDHMIALKQKKYDRTGLVYDAFVNQKNNDAKWLGSNDKLTRLKFYGGFETILRLKCPWPQFDVLWNKLDSVRSGELDKNEFRAFFGDFSEFEPKNRINDDADFGNLAKIMFELCNALRSAGFTVLDIFSSFDRNGSGEVSVSEFCSMLRVVLGKRVDKKQVFRSFSLMDVDSSRSISCNEVLMLVYNVWKSQMRELAHRLATLDEEYDGQLIQKIVKERNLIKEAVKKNFPREWRDRMERTGQTYSTGPFANLLDKVNVTTQPSSPKKGQYDTFAATSTSQFGGDNTHGSSQRNPQPQPPPASKLSQTAKAGRNEMMRYKISKSRTYIPSREGASLQVPTTKNLGADSITTEGSTAQRLHQTEPAGNKVFTLTS